MVYLVEFHLQYNMYANLNKKLNDTIRYIYMHAKADKMASLHKNKKIRKTKNNWLAQEKWCRQKSIKAVREKEVELWGIGFVKQVGFVLSQEWKSEGVMDEQSGETEEEEVIGEVVRE